MKTVYDFYSMLGRSLVVHPEWRRGQAAFNVCAFDFAPAYAELVRGTELDPFHNDKRIIDFVNGMDAWLKAQDARQLASQAEVT